MEIQKLLPELIEIPTYEELDERLKLLLKQKEVIDAEKAIADSTKAKDAQLEQIQKASEISANQKTIAENQKAVAQAQRDAILASFPQGATKPLEGDIVTSDKFGYITRVIAYETLTKNAHQIAQSINETMKKKETSAIKGTILIVNDLDVASGDVPLIQVQEMLELFKTNMDSQKGTNDAFLKPKKVVEEELVSPVALAPMAISGILSSIADIVGYFQVNFDIKGQDFTLDNQALTSIVAGGIENPVRIYNYNLTKDSTLLKEFRTILNLKLELDKTIDEIKLAIEKKKDEVKTKKDETERLEKRLGTLKDTEADKKEKANISEKLMGLKDSMDQANKYIDRANTLVTNSETLSKAFVVFADSITKTGEGNTSPLLVKAVLRKKIHDDKIKHLLNLKIASSGGEAITMKRRFPWLKDNSSFIGGSVISFVLADIDGNVEAANTLSGLARLGYQLSGEGTPHFNEITIPAYVVSKPSGETNKQTTIKVTCSSCGESSESGDTYCRKCGKPLTQSKPVASSTP